ncbi:MAG: hypothetical protein ACPG5P_02530, partial [Saprospiraceae bacterium]
IKNAVQKDRFEVFQTKQVPNTIERAAKFTICGCSDGNIEFKYLKEDWKELGVTKCGSCG